MKVQERRHRCVPCPGQGQVGDTRVYTEEESEPVWKTKNGGEGRRETLSLSLSLSLFLVDGEKEGGEEGCWNTTFRRE